MPSSINIQIDRRLQRALKEITRIANKGNHSIFSLFEVSSLSGQIYRVKIRSLSEMLNSCSCQDYRTNLIGTCKHIEAVLLYLKKKHRGTLEKMARKSPLGAQVYLRYEEEETVRVVLPLPNQSVLRELLAHYFDPAGVLIGPPLQSLPALFSAIEALAPKARAMIQVDDTVREYLERLQEHEEIGRQKTWFLEQMKKGARSVEKGHLPEDLAMRLARVRELTEPEHEGEEVPPPSLKAGEAMVASVQSLIDLGQEKEVAMGL